MKRSDLAETRYRLQHIVRYAREAITTAQSYTRADLDTNRLLNLALVQLITLIGEAAWHVPDTYQEQMSDIPWSLVISMRNRLIHGYDSIDYDVLWQTVINDLPELLTQVKTALIALDASTPTH